MFVPDCYKNQKVYKKAVDNYAYALKSFPVAVRLKKCAVKLPVNNYLSAIQFVPECFKAQKISCKVAS